MSNRVRIPDHVHNGLHHGRGPQFDDRHGDKLNRQRYNRTRNNVNHPSHYDHDDGDVRGAPLA